MGTKAFHNDTARVIHIGNKMIRPGETREVDETMIPTFKAEKPEAEPTDPNSTLLALLDLSIKDLIKELHGKTMAELDILEAAEKAGKTRAGALTAITEARLVQAAAEENENQHLSYQTSLAELSDEDLQHELDAQEDEELKVLAQAELERRTQPDGDAE